MCTHAYIYIYLYMYIYMYVQLHMYVNVWLYEDIFVGILRIKVCGSKSWSIFQIKIRLVQVWKQDMNLVVPNLWSLCLQPRIWCACLHVGVTLWRGRLICIHKRDLYPYRKEHNIHTCSVRWLPFHICVSYLCVNLHARSVKRG